MRERLLSVDTSFRALDRRALDVDHERSSRKIPSFGHVLEKTMETLDFHSRENASFSARDRSGDRAGTCIYVVFEKLRHVKLICANGGNSRTFN